MCGFTGFLSRNSSLSRFERHDIGTAMADAMLSRGPDAGDVWQDPDVPCVLGHRRLAIIDLSAEGAQPMESASGRYVITFNGEVYNFLELRASLEEQGVQFRGRSDTEIMLAAIEQWGLNLALQKFGGMFAFALWDRKERVIHFARDRMGKKPLYLGWAGKTLVFGSELKALRAHPDFKAVLNTDALPLYFRGGYVPAPYSVYQNVWSLKPAHRLTLPLDALDGGADLAALMQPYWSHLEAMQQAKTHMNHDLSDQDQIEAFDTLLGACVEERMMSDVPLGAFLSGGIDSSCVVALMQKQADRPVRTYTIGFDEAGFNEAVYARKVAAHLGTDHHEMHISAQDALQVIPKLSTMYDEPFADISAIPTYLVCQFARQDVTVALSGDGGDEMLGGYNRHVMGPRIRRRTAPMPSILRHRASDMITAMPVNLLNKLMPMLPQAGVRLHKMADMLKLDGEGDIYRALTSRWQDPYGLVSGAKERNEPQMALDDPYLHLDGLSFAEKMMFWDTQSYLPDDILVKVDRASMAVSLEARAPLLDKKIFDHVWSLPEDMKIRNGKGKWLLREVLARYVPRELFERPKQGFAMPVGEWLRGDLRDWAESLLDAQSIEADGLLNAAEIHKVWSEHKAGRGNHAERLWAVLMFQSWKEKWL